MVAATILFALFVATRAAPLDDMTVKDKKSAEVIYYERNPPNAAVEKRGEKLGWPSFSDDGEKGWKTGGSHAATTKEKDTPYENEKTRLTEALVRLLLSELTGDDLYEEHDFQADAGQEETATDNSTAHASPTAHDVALQAVPVSATTASPHMSTHPRDDSREDKRVEVEVLGGLPQEDTHEYLEDEKPPSGKLKNDAYREYLDMWYKTNIASDYEEDSIDEFRDYLEYMKTIKGLEEKVRKQSVNNIHAGSKHSDDDTKFGNRRKRSIRNGFENSGRSVSSKGIYLSAAEAANLKQLIQDLQDQRRKYSDTFRNLLRTEDNLREPLENSQFQTGIVPQDQDRNVYQLAYGLSEPFGRHDY